MNVTNLKLSDLYVSITQAANLLHVNRATITRWLKENKLSGERIGLTTLIPKEQIIALAQQRGQYDF